MMTSDVIQMLADAIDGNSIPGDAPDTADLLWMLYNRAADEGRRMAIQELKAEE